jgi:hypothetical protein
MIHGSFQWFIGELPWIPMPEGSWEPSMNHGSFPWIMGASHKSWARELPGRFPWFIGALPWMGASHEWWDVSMNHGTFVSIEKWRHFLNGISGKERFAKKHWEVINQLQIVKTLRDEIHHTKSSMNFTLFMLWYDLIKFLWKSSHGPFIWQILFHLSIRGNAKVPVKIVINWLLP